MKLPFVRGLTWAGSLQILDALPQSRGSRLTYDDGVLEITVPLEDHEFAGRLIERFILTLVELMGLRIKTMVSTTMTFPQLRKGAEPAIEAVQTLRRWWQKDRNNIAIIRRRF